MNGIHFQVKTFRMAAVALTMLALLLAGAVRPAQAQTYPVSFIAATQSWGANPNLWDYGYDPYDVNALATGDFNGDGKLDIVTGSYSGGTIGLLLGNGDNTFQPPLTIDQLSASVMSVVVGDFNGDGQLDVAALLLFSGSTMAVNVYLGIGDGTFGTATTFPLPGYTRVTATSLATGDFNGKLGLVVVDTTDGAVDVLLGNGDGTFKAPVAYSTIDPNNPGFTSPYGVTVADFNGDGQPDIAVGVYAGIAVLLNNGSGTFGTAVYYSDNVDSGLATQGIAAADLNHDKKIDIVLATGLGLVPFLNNGKGVFTPKALVGSGLDMTLVDIADVNGDGKPDLVGADLVGSVRIFLGKGTGVFTNGADYPVGVGVSQELALVVGDFNNDGHPDFAVGNNQGGQVLSALGNGDGTFRTTTEYGWQAAGSGYNVVAADFNGDGIPDVAYSGEFGTNAGSFAVMLSSSHGALATQTYVPAGCNNYFGPNLVEWVAAGDVNGDGKADVVATLKNSTETGCQSGTLAVVLGLGTGKFKAPVFYSTGSTAQSYEVRLADLNGDGKLDIVTANGDGTLSVLLNKGNGTFAPATLITSAASLNPYQDDLVIGDFTGDGKADIALATYARQSAVYVLLGNGDGTFGTPIVITTPYTPYSLAAGDFNNDGKLDLVVATQDCPYNVPPYYGDVGFGVLLSGGGGTFRIGAENCVGANFWPRPVVGDFNGDGKLDLFITSADYEQATDEVGPALMQGNGNGTFTRAEGIFYVGAVSAGAVVADFNGDGMPDIAVLNNDNLGAGNDSYSNFVTVMQNSSQPVSVSPLVVNYGTVAVGASKAETVVLTNDQSTPLAIGSITLSGTDVADFSAKSNCGTSRLPGADCTITVTAKPAATGARTATLSIEDAVGTQTVQLIVGVNPKPAITSLLPSSAITGSAGFTLTVYGTGFVSASVVDWAGSARTTTYVSATELSAIINAADIAKAGTFKVTVTSPAPGGGTSVASNFTVDNPAPTLISILPNSATHDGAAFTLTATGTNYISGSIIEWNGTKLTTKYVSSTTLTATVPAADIKTAGTASVTVVNPTPGGGTSAAKTFTIN